MTGWRRACLAFCLIAAPALAKPDAFTVQHDVAYGPLPEERGELYQPAGHAGAVPAVLMIHGGGWISGSRATLGKLGEVLASRGVAVFNIDYRLARADQDGTRWPAQLVDAQLAMRFLRSRAAEFGIDPARIGAMGDSAGGQLALFLGAMQTVMPGDQASLYATLSPHASVVVDEFGPIDIPGMGATALQTMKLLFGTVLPTPEMVRSASPLPLITSQTAPTYILHGSRDAVVPFAQSVTLDAALAAANVPHDFVSFEGGHEFEAVPLPEVVKLQIGAFTWLLRWLQ